jgi:hypothetical protein
MTDYPNIDDFVGGEGKYLKAADLGDDEWEMVISNVTHDEFDDHKGGKENKLILHFKGAKKAYASNVTNNRTLKQAYGEIKNWIGKPVVLFTVDTNLPTGEPVRGIRLKKPSQRRVVRDSENPAPLDDEIPF